jgi:hypothetical protein
MLCQQHGTVQYFNHSAATRHAVVTFTRPDDALKAQHALNGYVIANAQLTADFIPDAEFAKLANFSEQSASLTNIWSAAPSLGVPGGHLPEHTAWHSGIVAGGGSTSASSCGLWSASGSSSSVSGL